MKFKAFARTLQERKSGLLKFKDSTLQSYNIEPIYNDNELAVIFQNGQLNTAFIFHSLVYALDILIRTLKDYKKELTFI